MTWQWTDTPIYPFDGFRVHPIYDDFTTPIVAELGKTTVDLRVGHVYRPRNMSLRELFGSSHIHEQSTFRDLFLSLHRSDTRGGADRACKTKCNSSSQHQRKDLSISEFHD